MGMKYLTSAKKHKWYDCKKKKPSGELQYEYVLTYSQRFGYKILYYIYPENTWQTGGGGKYEDDEVTHWAYLPEQPKGHEW